MEEKNTVTDYHSSIEDPNRSQKITKTSLFYSSAKERRKSSNVM